MSISLTRLPKYELFNLVKKINPNIPYRKTTKKTFIEIIENDKKKNSDKIYNDQPIDYNDEYDYPEKYIQYLLNDIVELKNQILLERKETEKWRNKYIDQLENKCNQTQYSVKNPIENCSPDMINKMEKFMNNFDNVQSQINSVKNPIEKIEKVIEKVSENKIEKPFDLIPKIDKKTSKLNISEIIKQNSLIDFINSLTKDKIEDFGHKTRRSYFENRLDQMKKERKCLFGANLNKSSLKSIK